MKTKIFDFIGTKDNCEFVHGEARFGIPTLPAYAVEHYTVQMQSSRLEVVTGKCELSESSLVIKDGTRGELLGTKITLVVYHHGIRDYALLFPLVAAPKLRARLGEFYRESEAAFESGSWLSFVLMCGAMFEGVLFAKYPKEVEASRDDKCQNKSFQKLINKAKPDKHIDAEAADEMHKVRDFRNFVHANKFRTKLPSRADALDARVERDRLLER